MVKRESVMHSFLMLYVNRNRVWFIMGRPAEGEGEGFGGMRRGGGGRGGRSVHFPVHLHSSEL